MDRVKIMPGRVIDAGSPGTREHLAAAGRAVLADTMARTSIVGRVAMPDPTWAVALTTFIAQAAGESLSSDDAIKSLHFSVATGYRMIDLLVKEKILEISHTDPEFMNGMVTLSEKAFEDFENYILSVAPIRLA